MQHVRGPFARLTDPWQAFAFVALVLMITRGSLVAAQGEEPQRLEGAAIVSLADAAMARKPVPSDFTIRWHADFFKAQRGTFVPFILTAEGRSVPKSALLYVRAVPRGTVAERAASKESAKDPQYPVDVIFPVELATGDGVPARVTRGFAIPPGDYDVYLVLRERSEGPAGGVPAARAAVARETLSVPDFWTDELMTSSIVLADRLSVVDEPPTPDALLERPYVIGLNEVQPARDTRFRRDEELICVFLVYNPKVTADRKFDIEVEYHFFKKQVSSASREGAGTAGRHPLQREGESYVNHTEPQRFTAGLMGPQFDPSAGQPIMAGQGVPLAAFDDGEYRLLIKVTDLLAGKTLTRDVNFTVGS